MGGGADLEFGPARAVNPVSRRLADTAKAARMLGFTAEVDLHEGLRRLVKWWQDERMTAPTPSA
jgi:UDP-glucose 4-epimerase